MKNNNLSRIAQKQQVTSKDKTNFKGLIAHLLDILFVDNSAPRSYYAEDLSAHIQKDIGMYR
ncbi:hypothetical protein [Vibrio parahaemolyticus]|uniref:hypothetical protein n=1 Tax=Vibrio parahaemolyticus TaxID=670 RepID=UPI001110D229|nr:hypothetical protein [Vibrio parahaemolyticus]TMX40884.1 hypothetical protein DA098_03370 [Vibrio parahaemolyticus]TMX80021.1 hypothetical protein DA094_04590 [Vibrio parahaemolyticus]